MEFRIDFFFRIVMDLCFYAVNFLFFKIIYLHTPLLAGWNEEQMIIFVCSFIFVDAFFMTFFASNAWWLPISINRGDLDYYLTRPVSSFFFLTLKEFAANSLLNLILASALLWWALTNYEVTFLAWELASFILLLINGAILYYMTNLLFVLPVFWTGSPRGFVDVFFAADKVFQRPDKIFTGFIKRTFTTILPFCVMASLPTRFLFNNSDRFVILCEIAFASILIYFIIFIIWKWGIRSYSSASS